MLRVRQRTSPGSERGVCVRTILRVFLLGLAVLLPTAIVAQDQSAVTGSLNGTVIDTTGAAIPDATVTVTGSQGTFTTRTDSLGRFSAANLTPGYYDVRVVKQGFSAVQARHNEVTVSVASTLNLQMGVGSETTTVEVTAAAVQIDTTNTAVTTNLTDTFYQSVPMQRNVSAIFYAAPGVAQGQVAASPNGVGPGQSNPSIGGASGLENLYIVDGVTITDQAFGSIGTYNRYKGALGTGINLAFIKEVDVKTTAFEPSYGKATGGIVQIVTKSGGNSFHGALSAYFAPSQFWASRFQFYQFGYLQRTPFSTLSQPALEASAEFGGYVPPLRDKLFFFGAFDPSLNSTFVTANPNSPSQSVALGVLHSNQTTISYAGKLMYSLTDRTHLELTAFGDPARHNAVPNLWVNPDGLSSTVPKTTYSSFNFGSENYLARLDSALTPTWTVDAAWAYNHNHFDETPSFNTYQITNTIPTYLPNPGGSIVTGHGAYEPSKNNTWSIEANTSKIVRLWGQHTFNIGYQYDHTSFLDQPSRSGPLFPIPGQNAAGQSLTSLFPNFPASAVGRLSNALFSVAPINPANLADRTCTQCPIINGVSAYASVTRGTYNGLYVNAAGRYHTAFGEDIYQMNRHLVFDVGVRYENQRIAGDLLSYNFRPSWSPRMGVIIDPKGDQKSKLFFNFGRNYWAMPLDAAIRQLGDEQDATSFFFAPVVASDGTISVVPDAAHNLNGLNKNTNPTSGAVTQFGSPSFASSTGEGIIPGTRQEYVDEYVLGFERNLSQSMVFKIRYADRRLPRIIEDVGSQSPEGSTMLAGFVGGITNPNSATDLSVNEQEVTYTPAQASKNVAVLASGQKLTAANYTAPVTGCLYQNDTFTQGTGGAFFVNGLSQPVGGACFLNYLTAAGPPPDGIPDGFVKPERRYNAVEIELDRRLNHHWLAFINLRWANLWGNYEGAFRNDNGQSDPGISSLFDFIPGKLNLLGDQFTPGFLSTDRRVVGNMFLSYNVGSDSPLISRLKGLTFGLGLRGQSGVPLSFLGSHPVYLNQGEVPIGGRGAAGRTPASSQLDLHMDYPVHFTERYSLKFTMDMFNVTNSQFQTARVQFTQLASPAVGAVPALNLDYNRPSAFQGPFYARGSVRFEF